ncbi:GNAT family N-acetyltransferase [Cellulomonas sp. PSBB021]|uniref:GNAT family N-acetyltransferase n=1 Tax=Cellulomonas sp. PSBB021 TaxID=2003551 RepID=UPI000B8DB294|nr:GNAT family N-acetyltransferase [Cellulomonas sp. PSBB021]ASR55095.1 hypothetical protein CBP52_08345 [Cellulomonas sp. PSBB021]
MSQVLDLPVTPTSLVGDDPTFVVDEDDDARTADDVVVVFDRNVAVAGGSYRGRSAALPAPAGDGARVAHVTGVWVLPGRRRREHVRRALVELEASAARAGFSRLHVVVEQSRTDALALLRERWFTPVDAPSATGDLELEKWLLPA